MAKPRGPGNMHLLTELVVIVAQTTGTSYRRKKMCKHHVFDLLVSAEKVPCCLPSFFLSQLCLFPGYHALRHELLRQIWHRACFGLLV
mmetsp:Transcript_41281/g.124896  ORF Transcript_41281/g.124896 Transcript_41281/m.124896 type:complete len:88 (-) Transcript_41281:2904-3167(-)